MSFDARPHCEHVSGVIDARDLMRIRIATLFTLDGAGRLRRVNDLVGQPAPRFFLGRTARGNVWAVRHDVSEKLVRAFEALCASEPDGNEFLVPPYGARAYEALLAGEAPVRHVGAGPAYRFPNELREVSGAVAVTSDNSELLDPYMSAWREDVTAGVPFVVVVNDGHAVSVCCSVRVTSAAHEAGVETHADFRGRGYAALAAIAWARAVRAAGSIPLYSTSWENSASRAVARKLGLVRFGTDLHIT